jgi:hypothetical protein
MWRILRAFAWLRWRVLLNSLERRGSRDVIERFSLAVEQLAPTIAALLMLPSAMALAGVGLYAGYTLGHGNADGIPFNLVRYGLFAACALTLVGPIVLPAAERTNAVRLLLLPIPRGVLYLSQSISAAADPWILLSAAIVIAMPIGLAAAGSAGAAALAFAAGVLLLTALVGLTQLVTSAVHLIVRDRRRAELMTLFIVVFLPLIGMLPGLLEGGRRHRVNDPVIERRQQDERPRWWSGWERAAASAVPSELYVRAVRSAAASSPSSAAGFAGGLTVAAAALHLLALLTFLRLLASPGTVGSTRAATRESASGWRIPGLSPPASAVAVNQLRLAMRTPRGRATLLSPIVVFGLFAVMMLRRSGADLGAIQLRGGIGLASFASFVSLLAILPLAMNQFAIDRAGLTMAMLAPLETGALLGGKAVGNGIIVAIPAAICIAGAAILFPSGDPMMWACIPLTLVAAYLLVAPVGAMLSAVFPRAVDLNSIGRDSNAHGAAGLLGMLAFVAAAAPGLGIALTARVLLQRPALAPVGLLVWTGACLGISLLLFRAAAAVFERRRENLSLSSLQRPS